MIPLRWFLAQPSNLLATHLHGSMPGTPTPEESKDSPELVDKFHAMHLDRLIHRRFEQARSML